MGGGTSGGRPVRERDGSTGSTPGGGTWGTCEGKQLGPQERVNCTRRGLLSRGLGVPPDQWHCQLWGAEPTLHRTPVFVLWGVAPCSFLCSKTIHDCDARLFVLCVTWADTAHAHLVPGQLNTRGAQFQPYFVSLFSAEIQIEHGDLGQHVHGRQARLGQNALPGATGGNQWQRSPQRHRGGVDDGCEQVGRVMTFSTTLWAAPRQRQGLKGGGGGAVHQF